eukprot:3578749-Alexandrium_andersonii.AAC.1
MSRGGRWQAELRCLSGGRRGRRRRWMLGDRALGAAGGGRSLHWCQRSRRQCWVGARGQPCAGGQ